MASIGRRAPVIVHIRGPPLIPLRPVATVTLPVGVTTAAAATGAVPATPFVPPAITVCHATANGTLTCPDPNSAPLRATIPPQLCAQLFSCTESPRDRELCYSPQCWCSELPIVRPGPWPHKMTRAEPEDYRTQAHSSYSALLPSAAALAAAFSFSCLTRASLW